MAGGDKVQGWVDEEDSSAFGLGAHRTWEPKCSPSLADEAVVGRTLWSSRGPSWRGSLGHAVLQDTAILLLCKSRPSPASQWAWDNDIPEH